MVAAASLRPFTSHRSIIAGIAAKYVPRNGIAASTAASTAKDSDHKRTIKNYLVHALIYLRILVCLIVINCLTVCWLSCIHRTCHWTFLKINWKLSSSELSARHCCCRNFNAASENATYQYRIKSRKCQKQICCDEKHQKPTLARKFICESEQHLTVWRRSEHRKAGVSSMCKDRRTATSWATQ